jgi:hypothetical protein
MRGLGSSVVLKQADFMRISTQFAEHINQRRASMLIEKHRASFKVRLVETS